MRVVVTRTKNNNAPGFYRIPFEFYKKPSMNMYIIYPFLKMDTALELYIKVITILIHKKGFLLITEEFIFCTVSNLFSGILPQMLADWVSRNNISNEYQTGFHRQYSLVDNKYNLCNVAHFKVGKGGKRLNCFVVNNSSICESNSCPAYHS